MSRRVAQDAKGNVDLRMAVVRLPHVESDVLLTLHTPENVTRRERAGDARARAAGGAPAGAWDGD